MRIMTCERCLKPLDSGEHGLFLCPLEPRPPAYVVRPDSIPGGVEIAHGICNEDGSPRRYYSRSEIKTACAVKGLVPWTDVYTEDRTKDARVHDDWLQSGEAKRARAQRDEARQEKRLARDRDEALRR
jgi:hypothetical protein